MFYYVLLKVMECLQPKILHMARLLWNMRGSWSLRRSETSASARLQAAFESQGLRKLQWISGVVKFHAVNVIFSLALDQTAVASVNHFIDEKSLWLRK